MNLGFFNIISRIAIAPIFSLLLPLTCGATEDSARIRGIVDKAIHPVMAEHAVPGMVIAISLNGQSIFFNYGVASREKNTPVSEATIFEIGSVSKTFTATLASYAQVLGKLSMDDHPSKYLPQLKGSAIDKARLINLGTYTAGGLPLQFPDEVSNDRVIDYFRQWVPDAPTGTQREYSNPSIGLFGHITALALKMDFADAMETLLFPKLGLSRSYIRVPESEMVNYAWGYGKTNKPIRVNPGILDAQAYGVKSTATDMIRFVQVNITPSLLEGAVKSAVIGSQVGFFKVGEMTQGLGWEQYPYPITLERLLAGHSEAMIFDPNPATPLIKPQLPPGPILFNKTGSTGGFGSYVAFVPEKKIGVVMMANRNFPIPARIKAAHAILEQLALMAR
jgi:beta-lactamase class C